MVALLRRVSEALARPAELGRLVREIAEGSAALLSPASAAVYLLEPGGDALRARAGTGLLVREEGELLPLDGTLEGIAALTGRPQRATELASDPRVYRAHRRGLPSGPGVAVGLRVAARPVGALLLAREAGQGPFTEAEVARLSLSADPLASAVATALEFDRARESRAAIDDWRRERELRSRILRYDIAAREAGIALFEWDPRSGRLLWGDGLEPLLGYPPGEFAGTWEELSEWLHPEDRERVREEMEEAWIDTHLRLTLRLRHRNGTYRRFGISGEHVELSEGDPPVVVGVLEDLAVRGRRTSPKEKSGQEEPTRKVIRALRHELNNPLAVILGRAQLLEKESSVQEDPLLRESIGAIREESGRLLDLTRRLAVLEETGREPEIGPLGGLSVKEDPA